MQDMTVLRKMKDNSEITFVFAVSHESERQLMKRMIIINFFSIEITCFMMVYDKIFVTVLMRGVSFL